MEGSDIVTLLQGPLCGASVSGDGWDQDQEKTFKIAWEDFRYDLDNDSVAKVNLVHEPGFLVRGTATYRREVNTGHYVVERP